MKNVTVYVDGFNFYYGLKRMKTKDRDWRKFYWIDFVKFFDHFMGNHQILRKVVYFTTPPMNIQKRNRQGLLLKANQLLNGDRFEVIEGKFYEKEFICPVCGNKYTMPEEKRTDVNISVQMMRDCARNNTDVLILVSADSDLVPPLELVKNDYPEKTVKIFFPPKGFSYDLNNFIKSNKGNVTLLKNHKIRFTNSIMPDTVTKDGKTYTIPSKWTV
jgi:hypothetical protein